MTKSSKLWCHTLIIAEYDGRVVGALQLTLLPDLTHKGAWRALLQGVRVASRHATAGVVRPKNPGAGHGPGASRTATLSMVYKLGQEAERKWRRLDNFDLIIKVLTVASSTVGVYIAIRK